VIDSRYESGWESVHFLIEIDMIDKSTERV